MQDDKPIDRMTDSELNNAIASELFNWGPGGAFEFTVGRWERGQHKGQLCAATMLLYDKVLGLRLPVETDPGNGRNYCEEVLLHDAETFANAFQMPLKTLFRGIWF